MTSKTTRIVSVLAVVVAFGAIAGPAFATVEGPGPGLTDTGSPQTFAKQSPALIAPHHPGVMGGTRTPQVTPPVHQIVRPVHFAGRGVPIAPGLVQSSSKSNFDLADGLLIAGLLAGTFTIIAVSAQRPRPRSAVN